MAYIGNNWDKLLREEWEKSYYLNLQSFLAGEYKEHTIYPPANDIYNAMRLTSYEDVKVVILGQDPYHEPNQAHGLAFSVPKGTKPPPSLVNILKELESDLGILNPYNEGKVCPDGVLVPWAKQGVLLLNTVLTVRAHEAASHKGKGWELFTDAVIGQIAKRTKPKVFVLWGANARAKRELILSKSQDAGVKNLIIEAPHPSPLSAHRGFFGGRYFSRCNYFLQDSDIKPVDWSL
ncbi:MAG: uracil-DNA glycosylase [Clostridiales bacterium]|nr:uracil-DNA glycosylase [Clostridiales bacterium]